MKSENDIIAKELMAVAKAIMADDGKSAILSDNDHPKVYVGTYAKYNSGSLEGKWVDLTDFDCKEDFIDYCNELHSDEDDPELMFQDCENVPDAYYSESDISEDLWEYMEKVKDYDKEIVDAILDDGYTLDDVDDAIVYPNCYSMGDVARELFDDAGHDAFPDYTWENAFDYDHFGRELQWDMDDEELEQYEGKTDEEIGIEYVESIGGLEELGNETIEAYADFDVIGRDLEYDGSWIKYGNGYIMMP